jgi:hypothetical protein
VYVVPDPCCTNIVPVSPVLAFVIDKVLLPPKVILAFEPLSKFQDTVDASVSVCCSICKLPSK